MKYKSPGLLGTGSLAILLCCWTTPKLLAEKIWLSPTNGYWWDGTNWSGHTPPDITSFIKITNDLSKTVLLDVNTPATNLTVQKLTLSAPPGVTNTVLLSGLGVTNPLVFQFGLDLLDGGLIWITNSALQTQLTNDHVNLDGMLTLDSGLIDFGDTTVTTRVGRVTSGTFTINGGLVSAGVVTVGGLTNSSGALNLNGGTFNVSGFFSAGRNPATTGMVSVVGGQLNVPNDDTRVGDSGLGSLVVSNATVAVTNLEVGRDALSSGTVTVQSAGTIQVLADLDIARFSGSTGTVQVTGGQLLAIGQKISLARGGSGELDLASGLVQAGHLLVAADTTNSVGALGLLSQTGGTLALATNFLVGSVPYSTGQVVIIGGTVFVTNSAASATLNIPGGSLTLNGGSITTDNLILTNPAGQFLFNGGSLTTKGTAVANGSAFVLGDGHSPATLRLAGGTHSFANGLVISSNALLTGCGTILGTIINLGTISTNCSTVAQPAMLTFTVQGRTGKTNTVSLDSVNGATYTLQFKNLLTDPSWTDVLPGVPGTGNLILLRDTNAAGLSRFYRVRAQ